jgi:predicted HTH transcriptional regulator
MDASEKAAVNGGNVAGKVAVNGGNVAGKISEKIKELIKDNPEITVPEISANVGVSIRTIERKIQKLQKDNRLKRIGGANGGQWEVLV